MFLILPFWVPCECLRSSLMLDGWRASSPCSGLAGKLRMAVRALLPGLQVGDATWKAGSSCQSLLTSLYEVCTSSPRCWFWWGVALCILQAAAEGRQRLLACLLLDISQNGWREEQNTGGLVHYIGGVLNGVDSYPCISVSVVKVGCLTKRGESTAVFKALTTKQGIKRRQP